MSSYSSTEIVILIASGVFLGVVVSELVFGVLQIVLTEGESEDE